VVGLSVRVVYGGIHEPDDTLEDKGLKRNLTQLWSQGKHSLGTVCVAELVNYSLWMLLLL
jgi:hypothetical protein